MRTDGRAEMTKLIVAFRNFANAPKNGKAKSCMAGILRCRQLISNEDTRGDLEGETESEIRAAQEQALQTKYHETKILLTETANEDCVNSCMRQRDT